MGNILLSVIMAVIGFGLVLYTRISNDIEATSKNVIVMVVIMTTLILAGFLMGLEHQAERIAYLSGM